MAYSYSGGRWRFSGRFVTGMPKLEPAGPPELVADALLEGVEYIEDWGLPYPTEHEYATIVHLLDAETGLDVGFRTASAARDLTSSMAQAADWLVDGINLEVGFYGFEPVVEDLIIRAVRSPEEIKRKATKRRRKRQRERRREEKRKKERAQRRKKRPAPKRTPKAPKKPKAVPKGKTRKSRPVAKPKPAKAPKKLAAKELTPASVLQAARKVLAAGDDRSFGDRQVFIAAAYDALPASTRGTLADFKAKLLAWAKSGELHLVRADLVGVLPPALVERSEIPRGESRVHFVVVE
jgi:hypothetical protein